MWTPKFGQNSIRSFEDEFGIAPGMPDRKKDRSSSPAPPFTVPALRHMSAVSRIPDPAAKIQATRPRRAHKAITSDDRTHTACPVGIALFGRRVRCRCEPAQGSVLDKKTGAAVRRTRLLCIHAPTRTLFLRKRIDLDIVIGRLVPVSRIDLRIGHAECGRSAVSVKRNIDRFGFL